MSTDTAAGGSALDALAGLTDGGAVEEPLYEELEEWVREWFTPMFLHRTADNQRVRWCAQWWKHAEVLVRLKELWNGWEAARWDPSQRSGWWRDLEVHLAAMLSLDGPMRLCYQGGLNRDAEHTDATEPAAVSAPPGWWD